MLKIAILSLALCALPSLAQTDADPLAHLSPNCSRALLKGDALKRMDTVSRIQIDSTFVCGFGVTPNSPLCSRHVKNFVADNFAIECADILLFCEKGDAKAHPLAKILVKANVSVLDVCSSVAR